MEHSEDKADKYYDNFIKRFEELAEKPYLYQSVDHIRKGYRHSVCGIDTIYYRIDDDTIEIMSILGRQNVDKTLKESK